MHHNKVNIKLTLKNIRIRSASADFHMIIEFAFRNGVHTVEDAFYDLAIISLKQLTTHVQCQKI